MLWQWLIVGTIVFACLSIVALRAYRFGSGWFRPESQTSDAPVACSGCAGCHARGNAQPGQPRPLPLVTLEKVGASRPGSNTLPSKL